MYHSASFGSQSLAFPHPWLYLVPCFLARLTEQSRFVASLLAVHEALKSMVSCSDIQKFLQGSQRKNVPGS